MVLRDRLLKISLLRAAALSTLRSVRFDFSIRHPWVHGCKIWLNSYLHKGYWFHGKRREARTMQAFAKLIQKKDFVIEVGGHIGFISTYFASLTGPEGLVTVFEPGSNNLPYIRRNIRSENCPACAPIRLVEAAVGAENGTVTFFEDQLTGQNNSVIQDFKGLSENARNANVAAVVTAKVVQLIQLDDFFNGTKVDFVKIDVEGFELSVLLGMAGMVKKYQPVIMVEVQADHQKIQNYFDDLEYSLFTDEGKLVENALLLDENIFALHSVKHAVLAKQAFLRAG